MPSILSRRGVKSANLSDLLADFREQLERDAGVDSVVLIETNAALLLSDLCNYLGFSPGLCDKVVGTQAAAMTRDFIATRFTTRPSTEGQKELEWIRVNSCEARPRIS